MDIFNRFSDQLQLRAQIRDHRRDALRRQQLRINQLTRLLFELSREIPSVRPRSEHMVMLTSFNLAWTSLIEQDESAVTNPFSLIELRSHIATLLYVMNKASMISDRGYIKVIESLDDQVNTLLLTFIENHGSVINLTPPSSELGALKTDPNPSAVASPPPPSVDNSQAEKAFFSNAPNPHLWLH